MKFYIRMTVFILLTNMFTVCAQNNDQVILYINTYKQIAIDEQQRSGVPASIILAQGIHETQAGTSDLVIASNNHFGIKCKTGWTGSVVYHDDDARNECFRSYASAVESYRDHSDYLSHTPRYSFLFTLNPEDYEGWAYGLKKAGYATNIKYSQILIKFIKDYDLQKYSLIAMGKLPPETQMQESLVKEKPRTSLDGFTDSIVLKPIPEQIYPEGSFQINAAKCVYAKAGVSLLSISNQYDIPLAHLLDFNDMHQEDVLTSDQLIFLQRKRKIGNTPFHVVRTGETVYTISQTEGVRYENILEYNQLKRGEEPATGEKIYLQVSTNAKPQLINAGSVKSTISSS